MSRKQAEYRIDVRADGAGPPTGVRVRRWLKTGLRCYGFRCTAFALPDGPAVTEAGEVAADGVLDAGASDECLPSVPVPVFLRRPEESGQGRAGGGELASNPASRGRGGSVGQAEVPCEQGRR
jgi:hypothetical protein